jgi:hypothetical protein
MVKHRLNMMKHRLLVEKDRGNTCRKNQEKKWSIFLANFFKGLSFYSADCITRPLFPLLPEKQQLPRWELRQRTHKSVFLSPTKDAW